MAAPPQLGVVWKPDAASGKVSTTASGKRVWEAGVTAMMDASAADSPLRAAGAELLEEIRGEGNWRMRYRGKVGAVSAMAAADAAAAYAQAEASLAAFHGALAFQTRDGRSVPLLTAAAAADPSLLGEAGAPRTETIA